MCSPQPPSTVPRAARLIPPFSIVTTDPRYRALVWARSGTGVGTWKMKNVDCGKSFSDLGRFNILVYGAYVTLPWPVYGLVPSSWREEVVGA